MKKSLILFSFLFAIIGCTNAITTSGAIIDYFDFPLVGVNYVSEEPLEEGTDFYLYVTTIERKVKYGIGISESKPENFDNYNTIDYVQYEIKYSLDEEQQKNITTKIRRFEGLNPSATSSVMQKGYLEEIEYSGWYNYEKEVVISITFTEGTSYNNKKILLKMINAYYTWDILE